MAISGTHAVQVKPPKAGKGPIKFKDTTNFPVPPEYIIYLL